MSPGRRTALPSALAVAGLLLGSASRSAGGADLGTSDTTLWSPTLEWTLSNPSVSGNPFDLVASVAFSHAGSAELRTTEMFHTGGSEWRFRFTATRTGTWSFQTASADPDLDGHTGTVTVAANPDPAARGFLGSQGNRYALALDEQGTLEPLLYDVYMNDVLWNLHARLLLGDPDPNPDVSAVLDGAFADADAYGFRILFLPVMKPEVWTTDAVWTSTTNPLLPTFDRLDEILRHAHERGRILHLWMWGDASRDWSPSPINGSVDQRLQRYIAARLGPLPGWTLSYGFDLEEWASEGDTQAWAAFLHERMGWDHLLFARGRSNAELDANSYSNLALRSHAQIAADLDADPGRPHLYEERHAYLRTPELTMEGTRRFLWQQTVAGGMGGFWGFRADSPHPYPNPEQLLTHHRFWVADGRFRLDFVRDDALSDGFCLRDPGHALFVAYRENASTIQIDLGQAAQPLRAVAIDTKLAFSPQPLGTLAPGLHTLSLPYASDWAVAVGQFRPPRLPALSVAGLLLAAGGTLAAAGRLLGRA